ncbi:MAG: hypothetical protein M3545_14100, partial [Acidobacteriota bacterium]|nr:hypothetical protein [Acidobacteriota bacterium]
MLASGLLDRHVCLITGEEPDDQQAATELLARLGTASPRRHLLFSFGRPRPGGPAVRVEGMGIVALTRMVYIDPEQGPAPEELFRAARGSGGRPGEFLARLGACEQASHSWSDPLAVHETTQPYVVESEAPPPCRVPREKACARGVLHRAPDRGDALERAG